MGRTLETIHVRGEEWNLCDPRTSQLAFSFRFVSTSHSSPQFGPQVGSAWVSMESEDGGRCRTRNYWNRLVQNSKSGRSGRPLAILAMAHADNDTSVDTAKPPKRSAFQVGMLAGAVAGTIVDFTLYPLDTIKTRLQAGPSSIASQNIWQNIYRGLGPAVLASAPAAAMFFGTYEALKSVVGSCLGPGAATLTHLVAAAGGDIVGSTVRAPFEVVKQRMQTGAYSSGITAVRSILASEGVGGLYAGYLSLVLRELPFDLIEFPLYEFLKASWTRRRGQTLDTWQNSLCGSAAGGVAAALTTPLDVVKTRLMVQGAGGSVKYLGIQHGIQTILKEEGAAALFAGILPRVIWISLGGAIFFGGYEGAKKFLLRGSPTLDSVDRP